jgi:hypothetical protein
MNRDHANAEHQLHVWPRINLMTFDWSIEYRTRGDGLLYITSTSYSRSPVYDVSRLA